MATAMPETDDVQPWRYEPRKYDPDESQAVWKEILSDDDDVLTELDLSDEHDNRQVRLLVYQTTEPDLYVYDGEDTGVVVDFDKSVVRLSKSLAEMIKIEEVIPATQLRHGSLPWLGVGGERNDGRVIRLSMWDKDRGVRNLYLVSEDAKTALMLLNAVNRLIYETSKQCRPPRPTKFHVIREGSINMAMTSATERDQRDEIKMQRLIGNAGEILGGSKRPPTDDDEPLPELPVLKDSEFYFTMDEEALCVFDSFASLDTTHDFRFYREPTEQSVETIYSCHDEDQLELQRGNIVFYLHPATTQQPEDIFEDLVNYLKEGHMRPKPKNVFEDVTEFNRFFSPSSEPDSSRLAKMMIPPSFAGYQQQQQPEQEEDEPRDRDVEPSLPPIDPAMLRFPFPGSEQMRAAQAMKQADPGATARPGPADWLNQLNSGSHLMTVSEDLQMIWFEVEPQLSSVMTEGLVPPCDINSAGLDPQSSEHLQKLIEEIKDEMLQQQYGEAVAHLRECMKVFGTTLLQPLCACAELEMMKRIYFLSG